MIRLGQLFKPNKSEFGHFSKANELQNMYKDSDTQNVNN